MPAALKGSALEVAKGSVEDCLKKQSDANGSDPLKGSPPNGSKKTTQIWEIKDYYSKFPVSDDNCLN